MRYISRHPAAVPPEVAVKRILLLLAAILLSVVASHAQELAVDLRFEPTPSPKVDALASAAAGSLRPIRIQPFTDSRPEGETFLGDLNSKGQSQKVLARSSVAVFATDAFRRLFGEWGGKVSLEAPLVLKGEVTRFALEDAEGYQARVGFHFFLNDETGKVLWDGHCAGLVKGTGKTLLPENYSALFSDVVRETYAQLLADDTLAGVWSGKVQTTFIINEPESAPSRSATGNKAP
jgi:hypothetical protein